MSDVRRTALHALSATGEDLRRSHRTLKARSKALCTQSQLLRESVMQELAAYQEHAVRHDGERHE